MGSVVCEEKYALARFAEIADESDGIVENSVAEIDGAVLVKYIKLLRKQDVACVVQSYLLNKNFIITYI